MAVPITIPRLGWNMEEGVFAGWLRPDGAVVRSGEPLFRLESDKATEDVECLDGGILHIAPDGPREGDRLAVGAVIGYLMQTGDTLPLVGRISNPSSSAARGQEDGLEIRPTKGEGEPSPQGKRTISPRAKRIAAELGVDWRNLHGSGRTGRIRERDVRAAAAKPATDPTSSIRRTIAQRLLTSHHSTAPVTLHATADASNLVNLRNQFKAVRQGDVFPGYTDFLVKLTGIALQQHPLLNASWVDESIRLHADIHIGIAVDTPAGLLVPVLKDVASLGLKEIAVRSHTLIERARRGELRAEDLHGGTFTVTSLGAFGIDSFTPIINYPQCAILGVGRLQRQPVAAGDAVVIRDRLGLSLTFDHRILDGVPAARFVQTLTGLIENPGPWLVS
jgi:pyruvate dehydrogenase E2 component (dihydrolipoamide acetyltransferase)